MDELEFSRQFVSDAPPTLSGVLARALAADRDELAEARKEQTAAAAREARRENLAMANRQFGDPLGNLTRCQAAVGEARGRVQELEDQLAEARKVLHRCAEQYVSWQEQAEVVQAAVVSRSDDPNDMLSDAKRMLAEQRVDQMLAQRSAQGPARPKGRGGAAVRSEVTCRDCIAVGATPDQSFLIHQDPDAPMERELVGLSEKTLAAFGGLEVPQSERHGHTGAVISR